MYNVYISMVPYNLYQKWTIKRTFFVIFVMFIVLMPPNLNSCLKKKKKLYYNILRSDSIV